MYVYTDILLYIYCIYDIYIYYIYAYIYVCAQILLLLHVIQSTPFGESPRLSEWETTIGMLGRRSLEGYHCTCQSEQSLGSNGGQHLYDISVIFLKNSPNLGSRKKQNPWYAYTYIYIFFFFVEGFRMLLRRLIWEQHTQIFPSCCGFHIDSLCHILLNTSPRWRAPGWGWNWLEWCRVGMVDWFWIGILRIWNMSYMFFFGRYFTYIIECCLFMIVCWYYTNIKYYFHH